MKKNNNKTNTVITTNINEKNNKETTMKKNNMENMDSTVELGAIPFDNLEEIIPANELAVTEEALIEENKVVVVDSIEPSADMISEIPKDEREQTEASPVELAEIAKCGWFTPVLDMRGLITNTGHTFYAKICREPKTGQVIKYCQQYKNGTFSEIMIINKADLLIAATYHFISTKIPDTMIKSRVSKFILKTTEDYYGRLLYPREGLDIVSILNMLLSEYENLPVYDEVSLLEQPEKLYKKIIRIIIDRSLNLVDEHEAYYTLHKDQMEQLAQELNITRNKLLKKLKEYHFLYLTESSDGYQTCVRFKPCGGFFTTSHTEWCYCILKLDYLAKRRMQKAGK